jgi:trans-aconitate methyltransferase
MAAVSGWDAERYQRQFGFVSAMAGGVVELLDAAPGEVVLDLGCGTGELAARIAAGGARVIGLDSDPAMVAAAARRLGEANTLLADGHSFRLPQPVDAVFSNAALHWMARQDEVVGRVRAALRPGGRFVAERGGARNIQAILDAVAAAMAEAGLPEPVPPWHFPTPAEQATLLEAAGFRVARMEYFPRPTPLAGGPAGLVDWLEMFGGSLTAEVPSGRLPALRRRVSELAAPRLRRDGRWFADYWRLRFVAVTEAPGAGPT